MVSRGSHRQTFAASSLCINALPIHTLLLIQGIEYLNQYTNGELNELKFIYYSGKPVNKVRHIIDMKTIGKHHNSYHAPAQPTPPFYRFKKNIIFFSLFQLLQMLKFYARFEISDETGDPMADRDMTLLHYSRITSLQVSTTFFFSLHVLGTL